MHIFFFFYKILLKHLNILFTQFLERIFQHLLGLEPIIHLTDIIMVAIWGKLTSHFSQMLLPIKFKKNLGNNLHKKSKGHNYILIKFLGN